MPQKPPPPPDDDRGGTWSWDQYWDDQGWVFAVEWRRGDVHPFLLTITEYKLAALEANLRMEAAIFALVTTLPAKVKVADRAAYLKRFVDLLGKGPYRVPRRALLDALVAAYRHWLDVLYESARQSHRRVSAHEWEPVLTELQVALKKAPPLIPTGNPLAQALVTVLRLLEDRRQWPTFAADYTGRPVGNPVNKELTTVRQWYLIPLLKRYPEVQNDLMRLMGMLKDSEELQVRSTTS